MKEVTKKIYSLQSLSFLKSSKFKVGLLGGSFDPAHIGHLDISLTAIKNYGLDYVIWVVAKQNPHKAKYSNSVLLRAAFAAKIASHPRIIVSSLEEELGIIHSYNTIKVLHKNFPNVEFTWLMGIDNIPTFHKWYKYDQIPHLCKIIIFDRPTSARLNNRGLFFTKFKAIVAKKQTSNIILNRGPLKHQSSSVIRRIISNM